MTVHICQKKLCPFKNKEIYVTCWSYTGNWRYFSNYDRSASWS